MRAIIVRIITGELPATARQQGAGPASAQGLNAIFTRFTYNTDSPHHRLMLFIGLCYLFFLPCTYG